MISPRFIEILISGIIFILFGCNKVESDIRFSLEQIHLDTILYPSYKEFDIVLINSGGRGVKILDMTSSCDCTIFMEDSLGVVKPMDSIIIRGRIEPHISDIGKQRKILVTLKTTTENVFHSIPIDYFVGSTNY